MTSPEPTARGARKQLVGSVISDKMAKTIVVRVDRRVRHAQYEKVMTRSTRFYAHDEKDEAKVGDRVRIMETRPLSRLKRWRLVEVIERAEAPLAEIKDAVEEAAAKPAA